MSLPETFKRFLARQPILNHHRKFFAYEILSRYGPENYRRFKPGSPISVQAMDELFLMGVRTMTEGLPAFMNSTREFLINDYLTLMPKELVVGEILETVHPDAEMLAACHRMKSQGYRLALDDYCDLPETRQFLDLADFVKIDVLLTTFTEQKRVVDVCHGRGIPVVAGKVETDEHFRQCAAIGYDYFQGCFFCRPQILNRRSVPANKAVYLQLPQVANAPVFDLRRISEIFRRDVSLSYRVALSELPGFWVHRRNSFYSARPYASGRACHAQVDFSRGCRKRWRQSCRWSFASTLVAGHVLRTDWHEDRNVPRNQ
jgi:c-di-GMP-related signal transduction protein